MSAPDRAPCGLERFAQAVFAVMCGYECAAIATGRAPTVSALCRRRRWVEAGLLAFLLLHLHPLVTSLHIGHSPWSRQATGTPQWERQVPLRQEAGETRGS